MPPRYLISFGILFDESTLYEISYDGKYYDLPRTPVYELLRGAHWVAWPIGYQVANALREQMKKSGISEHEKVDSEFLIRIACDPALGHTGGNPFEFSMQPNHSSLRDLFTDIDRVYGLDQLYARTTAFGGSVRKTLFNAIVRGAQLPQGSEIGDLALAIQNLLRDNGEAPDVFERFTANYLRELMGLPPDGQTNRGGNHTPSNGASR